jgi:hypothetical protein
MLRALGSFEKAALVSNNYAPFNVTSVIRMQNAPAPEAVQRALDQLQQTHPLLKSIIVETENGPWFQEVTSAPKIPLEIIEDPSDTLWKLIAEQEMGYSFSKEKPPMAKAVYIISDSKGDFILTSHHALIDGSAGAYLIEQFLKLCADPNYTCPPAPIPEIKNDNLPLGYHGRKKISKLARFALSQLSSEITYQIENVGKRTPKVRHGGQGKVISISLTKELTNKIANQGRRERVTLNSILNAAQLLAVNKILYSGEKAAMQTFSFADLRPYLQPEIPPNSLGGWVTLFRILLDVSGKVPFWDFVKTLHQKITDSLNRGDKYNAFLTSEALLKMMIKMDAFRFGSSAINYGGVLPIHNQYGDIKVTSIHGLVSGYDLAPELSSQARIFNDQIIWDFIYLSTDMDETTALQLVNEIISILESSVSDL